MKKLFILLMMLITFNSYSQELTGCMGINFGDSKTNVKNVVSNKGGFVIYKDNPNILIYTDGNLAGHSAIGVIFRFHNNKMHTTTFLLKVEKKPMVMDFYRQILNELSQKYNLTPQKIHNFKTPYYEGDGYEHSAISLGYADIFSIFQFEKDNAISVEITKELSIKITYQNHELASKDIEQNKQQNSNDY